MWTDCGLATLTREGALCRNRLTTRHFAMGACGLLKEAAGAASSAARWLHGRPRGRRSPGSPKKEDPMFRTKLMSALAFALALTLFWSGAPLAARVAAAPAEPAV